jgi:hypothetical protein
VFEVGSFGDWTFNGVNHADLSAATISGFPIYHTIISDKQQKFDVVVGTHSNITLSSFKDMVSVMIKGTDKSRWANSTGLMGSLEGLLLARDGLTSMEDISCSFQDLACFSSSANGGVVPGTLPPTTGKPSLVN